MKYLTRFDMAVGGMVEKMFKLHRGFQPVDLARLLVREVMRNERISLKSTYVPNTYTVLLSADDLEGLDPLKTEVLGDLHDVLRDFVHSQELEIVGPLRVKMESSPELGPGRVFIDARFTPEN